MVRVFDMCSSYSFILSLLALCICTYHYFIFTWLAENSASEIVVFIILDHFTIFHSITSYKISIVY